MARYFRRGRTIVRFVPAIATLGAPTQAELGAGTNLTPQVADMADWTLANSPIPTPNMADVFTPQIEGEDTVGTPTITFYDDDASSTIRTALAKGTAGYIVIGPTGTQATKRLLVFPVKSTGVNDEFTVGNEAARFVVGFAITGVPNMDATAAA